MKNRRDIVLLVGLFLVLLLFVAFGPRMRPQESFGRTGSSRSAEADGTQALYLWLRDSGYDAQRLEYREFTLSEDDDALFIVNPSVFVANQASDEIRTWVENGGTLFIVQSEPDIFSSGLELLDDMAISRVPMTDTLQLNSLPLQQPLATDPAVREVTSDASQVFALNQNDYVTLLGSDEGPILVGMAQGSGYMYLSTNSAPFTNAGLRDERNAALLANLLRRVPAGGRIVFDEYHHGYFEPPTPTSTAFRSPVGWALTYGVLVIGLFLLLSGKRFGTAVPVREATTRRNSAEYVESMADMLLRAGKREYVQRHYYQQFKRALARPAGINPLLPDAEFVRELARFRSIDEPALLELLTTLRKTQPSEPALMRAVAQAYAFQEQYAQ